MYVKYFLIWSLYHSLCMAFGYDVCIERSWKRKGDSGDAPGTLAKQFSLRIVESSSVAGSFP